MNNALWPQRPAPSPTREAATLGRWRPADAADLTANRMQLAEALHAAAADSGADEGAIERLLLAFEELVSNGLRHGRPPVTATITCYDNFWLLQVSDAATDRPPTPAVDRDAAHGGLGLYLVARICGAHGWTTDGNRKTAWCRIDYTRTEAPAEALPSLPHPRAQSPRARCTP